MSRLTLLCVVVAAVFATAQGAVVKLTNENYDSIVNDSSKDVFVKFYAPWCGHCKSMAKEWESLATSMAQSHPDVVIAEVDCTVERDIATKQGIRGFPTLKFFSKSSKTAKDYSGPRTHDAFKTFIEKNTLSNQ